MATKVLFIVNLCYFAVVFVASGLSDYLSRKLLRKYGIPSANQGSFFVARALQGLKNSPRLSADDRKQVKVHCFIQIWGFLINILLFVALLVVFWIETS